MPTATIIGASGLVGSHLLKLLLADARFSSVVSLGRRRSATPNPKLEEHLIDFDKPEGWASLIQGEFAFSALGTTIAQAGSKEVQRKVDFTYQLEFAKRAAQTGVKTYALCSSASASASSPLFYSRLKGELDRDVQALGFERVRIMRPSLLGGEREKPRTGEKFGSVMLGALNAIGIARKSREIPGEVVARAMLNSAFDPAPGTKIYTLDEVFTAAGA